MSDEQPQFFSAPLGEPKKKKRARASTPLHAIENPPTVNTAKISAQLEAIYQDADGQIPNMTTITRKRRHPIMRFFLSLLMLGTVVALGVWAVLIYVPNITGTSASAVTVEITGPTELTFGNESTFYIHYRNSQSTSLTNVTLDVRYPEQFMVTETSVPALNQGKSEWNLGELAPHSQGQIAVTGRMSAAVGSTATLRAFLNYKANDFRSALQQTTVFSAAIQQSPWTLTLHGPEVTSAGSDTTYTFNVSGQKPTPNGSSLTIVSHFPASFHITTSTPAVTNDNKWNVAFSNSSTEISTQTFSLTGRFGGGTATNTPVSADLVFTNTSTGATPILLSTSAVTTSVKNGDLDVALTINGSADTISLRPGDMLNLALKIHNLGTTPITNVEAKIDLDSPSLNRKSVIRWSDVSDASDGDITGIQLSDIVRRGEIIWGKKQIATLAQISPGQEVTINFRVPIYDNKTINLKSLSDSIIKASSEIKYAGSEGAPKIASGNTVLITLNSNLSLHVQNEIHAGGAGTEIHTITWTLSNTLHALSNVHLVAEVYGDVSWQQPTVPAGTAVFDPKTKKITWDIPLVTENTDTLALPFTLTLQNKNTTQAVLVSKVKLEAKDTVTGETILLTGSEVPLN